MGGDGQAEFKEEQGWPVLSCESLQEPTKKCLSASRFTSTQVRHSVGMEECRSPEVTSLGKHSWDTYEETLGRVDQEIAALVFSDGKH